MNILLCGEYYVIACVEDELRSKFKRMKMLYFIRDVLYFSTECFIYSSLDLEKKKKNIETSGKNYIHENI